MASAEHIIGIPAADAIALLPDRVESDHAEIQVLGAVAPGVPRWRWSSAQHHGEICIAALSPTTSCVEVTCDGPPAVAQEVAVAVHHALEPGWHVPAPAAAIGPGVRRRVLLAVAAVVIPALALFGFKLLAPPAPVDVAAAVSEFRAANAGASEPAQSVASSPQPRRAEKTRQAAADPAPPAGTAEPGSQQNASNARVEQPRASQQQGREDAPASNDTGGASSQSAGDRPTQRKKAPADDAPRRPESGVYTFATKGYEQIDKPSSRHDYPRETAFTIQHTDCGFVSRWQPLENRWDEMSVCSVEAGAFIERMSTHREFFGQEKHIDYDCGDDTVAWSLRPGSAWSGRCSDGSSTVDLRGQTLGREPVRVGDDVVEAVHFTVEGRLSGDTDGTWFADRWVDPETGLLVRLEARTNATSDTSVGKVEYEERVSLRLLSMTPQR